MIWSLDCRTANGIRKLLQPESAAYRSRIVVPGKREVLTVESERRLLEWCQNYGLLGILPHRAVHFTLAPREKKFPRKYLRLWHAEQPPPRLIRTQVHFYRVASGWRTLDRPLQSFQTPPPRIVMRGVGGEELDILQLINAGRFFKGIDLDSPEQWDNFRYPVPLSDRFWKLYGEPLDDFLRAADNFRHALIAIRQRRAPRSIHESVDLDTGLRFLQGMLAPVSMTADFKPGRGIRPKWISGSLLAAMTVMALADMGAGRVLRCMECGKPYISKRIKQTRYCSKQCRWRVQMRVWRSRKKKRGLIGG